MDVDESPASGALEATPAPAPSSDAAMDVDGAQEDGDTKSITVNGHGVQEQQSVASTSAAPIANGSVESDADADEAPTTRRASRRGAAIRAREAMDAPLPSIATAPLPKFSSKGKAPDVKPAFTKSSKGKGRQSNGVEQKPVIKRTKAQEKAYRAMSPRSQHRVDVLAEKQNELDSVAIKHDDAVRELFCLDQYTVRRMNLMQADAHRHCSSTILPQRRRTSPRSSSTSRRSSTS